jgi:cytoskeletal protein RodZ
MGLILLEALLALLILLAIVWWTMFSGRDKGELTSEKPNEPEPKAPPKE